MDLLPSYFTNVITCHYCLVVTLQTSFQGHPILGDQKYGSKYKTNRRLLLHSFNVQILHPMSKKNLYFESPLEGEMNATGPSGSVLILDSRMWHATAKNISDKPRVGLAIRYAPWWLNLDILMPGSEERKMMVDEPGVSENEVPRLKQEVYNNLPNETKPLFRHWLHAR